MEVVREATRGNAASRVRVFTANPVPFTDARQFDPTGSDSKLESYLKPRSADGRRGFQPGNQ
jgi:hypothetical protein